VNCAVSFAELAAEGFGVPAAVNGRAPLSQIRGRKVAIEYLLQAMTSCPDQISTVVAANSRQYVQASHWAAASASVLPAMRVVRLEDLRQGVVPVDVWIGLSGDLIPLLNERNRGLCAGGKVQPLVCLQHGLSIPRFLYDRYLRLLFTPHYACDALVCPSQAAGAALRKLLAHLVEWGDSSIGVRLQCAAEIVSLPLAIDTDRYRPPDDRRLVRAALGLDDATIVLTYVGFISLVKSDIGVLLRVFRDLVARCQPDRRLRLILAGTGNPTYMHSLSTYVCQLGLAEHVSFVPELEDQQKIVLLQGSDIFVSLPDTTQESFGLTPVEAMSCGVPQVGSDWSGYRESIIDGETGFLIPTIWTDIDGSLESEHGLGGDWHVQHAVLGQAVEVDMQILASRLQLLVEDAGLRRRMAEASRRRAVAEFSFEVFRHRLRKLVTTLTARAPAKAKPDMSSALDRPNYYSTYGHYASRTATPDDRLRLLVRPGDRTIHEILQVVQSEVPGVRLFDAELLERVVETLARAVDGMTCADLICAVSGCEPEIASRQSILRHVQWLRKQGCILGSTVC
jgi:D-inositol-3-phosphate glycosyltransferase